MAELNQFIDINPNDHIVCVNISKTFDANEREDNYDRARRYWRINVNRARNANLVLAVVHGIVVDVFEPTLWYESKTYVGRFEFEGKPVENSPYKGKCVWNVVNPKSQSPILYINL